MHCLYNSQVFFTQKIRGGRISRQESPSWEPSWDLSWDANRAPDHDLRPNLAKSAQLGAKLATVNHPNDAPLNFLCPSCKVKLSVCVVAGCTFTLDHWFCLVIVGFPNCYNQT